MKVALLALCAASFSPAFASVYVEETSAYTDSAGAYAVVGAVKNDGSSWVSPRVHVSAGSESATAHLAPVGPGSEMPFKVRLAMPPGDWSPSVRVEHDPAEPSPARAARVMYDGTLTFRPDGSQAGMVVNTGKDTLRDLRVYAVAHAEDGSVLDAGHASLAEAPPGLPVPFEIRADPAVAAEVGSYSCFAIGEPMVVEYTTERNGEPFDFRYDSAVWLAYAQFDEGGGTMSMLAKNSFPFEALANVELPAVSGTEEFAVTLDGQSVESQQSIGEMGNWHLVFKIGAFDDGNLEISGFADPEPGEQWWYYLALPAAAAGALAWRLRRAPSPRRAP